MADFSISWSTCEGRFGWVSFADCEDLEDAVSSFERLRADADCLDVPWDADLDTVREVVA